MGKEKICLIGHLAEGIECYDGQTIKTRELYKTIINKTDYDVIVVDTFLNKKNKIKLFINAFFGIIKTRKIIVLLSKNGRRIFFPILYLLTILFKYKIINDVIGGNIANDIANKKRYIKYLNSFALNIVETNSIKDELIKIGIKNILVIPNYRSIGNTRIMSNKDKKNVKEFCTFSRVMKEKGIDDAIKAIEEINRIDNVDCKLDIYGPIDDAYKEYFYKEIEECKNVKYRGVVSQEDRLNVLNKYYALLFPTFWIGEGMAGTLIDALQSGLPAITTNFKSNKEVINDGYTGLIYPNKKYGDLKKAILYLINNENIRNELADNCLKESRKYSNDDLIDLMINKILEI